MAPMKFSKPQTPQQCVSEQPNITPSIDKVLIASKATHKGALFGHISNGGGIIDLGYGYSVQFVAMSDKFVTLQLFHHAIGERVMQQTWQKAKIVVEKQIEQPKQEIKIEAVIEEETAW
jgi:hypothetical protein